MNETFRTKVEPKEEAQPIPGPVQPKPEAELTEGKLEKEPILRLDVWENEKGHKFAEDYFEIREIVAEDKIMRMKMGMVDKYIKALIEKKGYSNTIDNYAHLLNEIEAEIGTNRMDVFKRLEKLSEYVKVMNKFNHIKELRDKYKNEHFAENTSG